MMFLRRIVPLPLLTLTLLAIWLVLARSASLAQIVLGLVVSVLVPVLVSNLWPPATRFGWRPIVRNGSSLSAKNRPAIYITKT